jgi:hypothetical protein
VIILAGKKNRKGNRKRGGSGQGKKMMWLQLAVVGVIPDPNMSMQDLKQTRDMVYAFLPGGQIGDGIPNTHAEIFGSMLRSLGFVGDDVSECIGLVWGSGKAAHWSDLPDFDPSAENKSEAKEAKMYGANYAKMHAFSEKQRKYAYAKGRSENLKRAKWKEGWMGG